MSVDQWKVVGGTAYTMSRFNHLQTTSSYTSETNCFARLRAGLNIYIFYPAQLLFYTFKAMTLKLLVC